MLVILNWMAGDVDLNRIVTPRRKHTWFDSRAIHQSRLDANSCEWELSQSERLNRLRKYKNIRKKNSRVSVVVNIEGLLP